MYFLHKKFATRLAMTNKTAMTDIGVSPPRSEPGSSEEEGVGRPKKYLTGPDFVIP